MIDAQGFRANVGIILLNDRGQAFWGRRIGMAAWQFPQGGINPDESLEAAMFRELREEVGLEPHHVEVIGCTRQWLRYRLPKRYIRYDQKPVCIGQKQRWYVLRLTADEANVDLKTNPDPEFDQWRWIGYWDSLDQVVAFKRGVYTRALNELAPLVENVGLISIEPRVLD
jgi:putative (di)nucleoside polyphosphate hydrolase